MQANRYAIHFYDDPAYLFQTVTMVEGDERDAVLDALEKARGWFWGRFKRTDREGYMARRVAVEQMLHDDFARDHWPLASSKPVYLYHIPGLGPGHVDLELLKRRGLDRHLTTHLIVDLDALGDKRNLSFTVGDSCWSYRSRLIELGIPCRPLESSRVELPDHGRVFRIDELDEVCARKRDISDLSYEIQVWKREMLFEYVREREPALWSAMGRG